MKINKAIIWLLFILMTACSASKKIEKSFKKKAENEPFFVGLHVVNVKTGEPIADFQGDKLFTPASNVKLFTLYSALKVLPDSVSSFEYLKTKDSLIIKGTANPIFLMDSLGHLSLDFLKNSNRKIYLLDRYIDDPVYGPGWSWDDYSMGYMPEKNLFPLYGNTARFVKKNDSIKVYPDFFEKKFRVIDDKSFGRDKDENIFYLDGSRKSFNKSIPFITSNQLVADLLSEKLGTKVTLMPDASLRGFKSFKETPYDSLYVKMIKDSDNFIAEQILLQVSQELTDSYSSSEGIQYLLDSSFVNIPQKPRWVDGSGLSRYNLFSPQSMVYILQLMYRDINTERLFSFFPQGGEEGTLKNDFKGMSYVSAKSGTLSNNYCLSGYLTTKKGTVLAFSYMNNHYKGYSSERKSEMIPFFKELYENF